MRKHLMGAAVATTAALLGLGTLTAPTAHAVDPTISGRVTAQVGGLPLKDIAVVAFQQLTENGVTIWAPVDVTHTTVTGDYVLSTAPGTYRLEFVECADPCADPTYAPEFYNDVATVTEAQDITVTANDVVLGINAALAPGYLLSGHVTGPDAENVVDGAVTAYTQDGDAWTPTYNGKLGTGGLYSMVVPAGDYRLKFAGLGRNYAPEFYDDKPTLAQAQTLAVSNADVANVDAQLALVKVQPQSVPVIGGVPYVGGTLQAQPVGWQPASPNYTYTYEWFRSGAVEPIGTTTKLVIPPAADGQKVWFRITASLDGYATNSVESVKVDVSPAPTALKNLTPPQIGGVLKVGETIGVTRGTWEKQPTTVAYQWYAGMTPITGATKNTLLLTPALLGKRLWVNVAAVAGGTLAGYSATAASGPVQPGTLAVATAPTLKGKAKVGRKLKVLVGQTLPAATQVEIRWLVRGRVIAGATKATFKLKKSAKGAKVRALVTYTAPGYAPLVVRTKAVRVR